MSAKKSSEINLNNSAQMDQTPELWQYVRMDQYSRPKPPAGHAVRKGLLGFWDRVSEGLTQKNDRQGSSGNYYIDQSLLHTVPQRLLELAAPEPNWNDISLSLSKALDELLQNGKSRFGVQFIVFPNCSGTEGILLHLATKNNWQILMPPEPAEILKGGVNSLAQLQTDSTKCLLIPQLQRWYLRHHEGLALIRKLIGLLYAQNHDCLIGVNSWSWAYLNRVLNLRDLFEAPLVLQALDGERLQFWFQRLANSTGRQKLIFRQTDNGNLVIPRIEEASKPSNSETGHQQRNAKADGPTKSTKFLVHLAGHSRGIPMVAWSLWRYCLSSSQSSEETNSDSIQNETRSSPDEQAMWLKPWSQTDFPVMPGKPTQIQIFALHNLLLHGPMELQLIVDLLPFSKTEVVGALRELFFLQMISVEKIIWQILPLGYPAIRSFLESEDFLLDDF